MIRALIGAALVTSFGMGVAGTSPGLSNTIEGSFIRAVQTWDLNHDGYITCEEWRTYAASLFKEADSDHDCQSAFNRDPRSACKRGPFEPD